MRFSERIGKKKPKCNIQLELMDSDLRTGLWNVIYEYILYKMQDTSISKFWKDFFTKAYDKFFKQPIDQITWSSPDQIRSKVRDWFSKAE
jgi:hypothetical protein